MRLRLVAKLVPMLMKRWHMVKCLTRSKLPELALKESSKHIGKLQADVANLSKRLADQRSLLNRSTISKKISSDLTERIKTLIATPAGRKEFLAMYDRTMIYQK